MSDSTDIKADLLKLQTASLEADASNSRIHIEVPAVGSRYVPPEKPTPLGRLITFYSYKGGVGRSRALANVAVQLALGGRSVLCLDFDLEAPGLSSYFSGPRFSWNTPAPDLHAGLIDLFCAHRDNLFRRIAAPPVRWRDLVQTVSIGDRDAPSGSLDFIGPGRQDRNYMQQTCTFDWRTFYDQWDGGLLIEQLRTELTQRYEYVLVDSRTGVTDISGICTAHLPDVLVAVFTPGPQSQRGLVDALQSVEANKIELRPERPLHVIPLPCRVDRDVAREAYDTRFKRLLDSYFAEKVSELGLGMAASDYFRRVSIEHFSRFVYDDAIESLEHNVADEGGNAWKYRNLISVIESLGPIRLSASVLGLRDRSRTWYHVADGDSFSYDTRDGLR